MTAPATPPDWDAVARFLSGESSAEEAAVVREWLEANPVDRDLVQRLNSAAVVDADVDVEAALARVHRGMAEPERPRLTVERGGNKPADRTRRFAIIATTAAAAIVIFTVTYNRSRPTPASAGGFVRTYTTGVGKRDSVLLADGSRVMLGPQSRLVVPSDFAATSRRVELTGDAYFDVRHDAARPFTVRAAKALVEDIGTTFTIESDPGDMTTVAVVSGSVRLRADSSAPTAGIVLRAGDRGSLDENRQTRLERNAVHEEDVSWVSGRLAFRDAPVARVVAEMQRWYGVKLHITDSALLSRHINTSFEGVSADQALRILGLSLGAKIERQGDSAIVSPLHGPATSR